MALATAAYVLARAVGAGVAAQRAGLQPDRRPSVVGLIVGARRNAPRRRLPWYLLAVGQALFVTSDVLAYNYERLFGERAAVPVGRRLLPPRLLSVPRRRHAAADPRTRGGPRPQRR